MTPVEFSVEARAELHEQTDAGGGYGVAEVWRLAGVPACAEVQKRGQLNPRFAGALEKNWESEFERGNCSHVADEFVFVEAADCVSAAHAELFDGQEGAIGPLEAGGNDELRGGGQPADKLGLSEPGGELAIAMGAVVGGIEQVDAPAESRAEGQQLGERPVKPFLGESKSRGGDLPMDSAWGERKWLIVQ